MLNLQSQCSHQSRCLLSASPIACSSDSYSRRSRSRRSLHHSNHMTLRQLILAVHTASLVMCWSSEGAGVSRTFTCAALLSVLAYHSSALQLGAPQGCYHLVCRVQFLADLVLCSSLVPLYQAGGRRHKVFGLRCELCLVALGKVIAEPLRIAVCYVQVLCMRQSVCETIIVSLQPENVDRLLAHIADYRAERLRHIQGIALDLKTFKLRSIWESEGCTVVWRLEMVHQTMSETRFKPCLDGAWTLLGPYLHLIARPKNCVHQGLVRPRS